MSRCPVFSGKSPVMDAPTQFIISGLSGGSTRLLRMLPSGFASMWKVPEMAS